MYRYLNNRLTSIKIKIISYSFCFIGQPGVVNLTNLQNIVYFRKTIRDLICLSIVIKYCRVSCVKWLIRYNASLYIHLFLPYGYFNLSNKFVKRVGRFKLKTVSKTVLCIFVFGNNFFLVTFTDDELSWHRTFSFFFFYKIWCKCITVYHVITLVNYYRITWWMPVILCDIILKLIEFKIKTTSEYGKKLYSADVVWGEKGSIIFLELISYKRINENWFEMSWICLKKSLRYNIQPPIKTAGEYRSMPVYIPQRRVFL